MSPEGEDISYQVFGKYASGFYYGGFAWSDQDDDGFGKPNWGSLSAPGKVRVRYVPGFKLWQALGLIPNGEDRS